MSGYIIDYGAPTGGRLELLDSLGSGAYGEVFRAVDKDAATPSFYAVKCLTRHAVGSRQETKQKRERRLHGRVSGHPNVVTFHKAIYDDFYVFFVLDLCSGGTLFEAISEHKLFYRNDILLKQAFVQIIDAVQYCHDHLVFHRDLKPENILCSRDGSTIYVSDFGLATRLENSESFGCGTRYYKSPECTGENLKLISYSTRQSDVWALGVVLVNMTTGRSPWRLASLEDIGFRSFLRHRSYLEENLPLSKPVAHVLRRIFDLNPCRRITLKELRKEILEIDTFFLSDDELLRSSEQARQVAKLFAPAPSKNSPTKQDPPGATDNVQEVKPTLQEAGVVNPKPGERPPTVDSLVVVKPRKRRRSSVVETFSRLFKSVLEHSPSRPARSPEAHLPSQ
ncbi:kinase-like protein [Hymenopellis radicata]|nr:kinase-like protein [Hymenopellis radicata]